MAAPTNELLYEISANLGDTPHHVRTGVLGVRDADGALACRKAAVAKAVQAAGGNVHRVLCSSCEFKDGCPARAGASRVVNGGGTLHLTNHTLMPSVAGELIRAGRLPLLVWDESPPMTEVIDLPWADLLSLRARCLADLAPVAGGLVGLLSYPVFDDATSACYVAMCDVLLSGLGVDGWGRVPANVGRVRSLRARFKLSLRGPTEPLSASEFLEVLDAAGATGTDASGVAFDRLPAPEAQAHAAAWRVARGVRAAFGAGASLRVVPGALGGVVGIGLTPAGLVWRSARGVVVADATADLSALRAVRGGGAGRMAVSDVAVADAPGVSRVWAFCRGLTRTGLGLRTDVGGEPLAAAWAAVSADLRVRLARLGGGQKVVVFTFKDVLERGVVFESSGSSVEYAYYGNVRGYNKYFEQGYTVYVTVGDPFPNTPTVDLENAYLGLSGDRRGLELASGELAQAHGRSRDPQRVSYKRLHVHYGSVLPQGWDVGNVVVDVV